MPFWDKSILNEVYTKKGSKEYRNKPKDIMEMLSTTVQKYPNKIALIEDNKKITYKEFEQLVRKMSLYFINHHKVKQKSEIAISLKNTNLFCVSVFAIINIGAIVIPLNNKLKSNETIKILKQTNIELFISDSIILNEEVYNTYQVPVYLENELNDIITKYKQIEKINIERKSMDPAFILFTTGSTGNPKGVILNHSNVVHACITYQLCYHLDHQDSTIIAVPIFHGTGLFAQLMPFIYLGGTIVLLKTFHVQKMLQASEQYQITHTIVVPTIYIMIFNFDSYKDYHVEFKTLGSGGAPLSQSVTDKIFKWLPKTRLINTYGLTEATSPAILMPHKMAKEKPTSIGIPSPITDLKIVELGTDNVVPPGKVGELFLKGPLISSGYLNDEENNKKSFSGNWLKTGDLARKDNEGFVYIVDRVKDMINCGGEKVYSIEVEEVLYNYPDVLEAAVIGVEDDIYGEIVKAYIVLKSNSNLTLGKLLTYCKQHLAGYKVPKEIKIVNQLPKSDTGKIFKRQLNEYI